jgi:hypothetical protein
VDGVGIQVQRWSLMSWFLDEAPMGILVGVLLAVLVVLLGYTVLSRYMGSGAHVVKRTTTFEYQPGEDKPVKKSVSDGL